MRKILISFHFFGFLASLWAAKLTDRRSLFVLVNLSLVLLSVSCVPMDAISPTTESVSSSQFPTGKLAEVAQLQGQIPLREVLRQMQIVGILSAYPPIRDDEQRTISVGRDTTWWSVVTVVEGMMGWVYEVDSKMFQRANATSTVDAGDSAGRLGVGGDRLALEPRRMVRISFRFVRGTISGGSVDLGINAAAQIIQFDAWLPAGVSQTWSSVSERAYFEAAASVDSDRSLPTTRRVVPAGVQYEGVAAVLPGGFCRVDAKLSVSSFLSGLGAERAVVDVPIQADGLRGTWVRVFQLTGADANVRASLRDLGFQLQGGADCVVVFIRVI